MAQPKFITSRSGLETDTPLYIGHVQHERSLNVYPALCFTPLMMDIYADYRWKRIQKGEV